MGNGVVSLSDSIKESLVGVICDEFEMQKQELIVSFGREKQEMLDSFALKLAVKDNEIAMLRDEKNGNNEPPTTSSPQGASCPPTTDKAARIKQLEQQNANLATAAHGQQTELGKYNHGEQQNTDVDTLDLDGADVQMKKMSKWLFKSRIIKVSRGRRNLIENSLCFPHWVA